jgi:hypothetical protein
VQMNPPSTTEGMRESDSVTGDPEAAAGRRTRSRRRKRNVSALGGDDAVSAMVSGGGAMHVDVQRSVASTATAAPATMDSAEMDIS